MKSNGVFRFRQDLAWTIIHQYFQLLMSCKKPLRVLYHPSSLDWRNSSMLSSFPPCCSCLPLYLFADVTLVTFSSRLPLVPSVFSIPPSWIWDYDLIQYFPATLVLKTFLKKLSVTSLASSKCIILQKCPLPRTLLVTGRSCLKFKPDFWKGKNEVPDKRTTSSSSHFKHFRTR